MVCLQGTQLRTSKYRSTKALPDKHKASFHMSGSEVETGYERISAFYDPSTPRERPRQGPATPLHFVLPGASFKPDLGPGATLSTSVPAIPQGSDGHHINSSYNSEGVAAPPPGAGRAFGGPDAVGQRGGLTPAQNYQLQLYLLEQSNKKRLMMARQEIESTKVAQDAKEDHKKHTHRAKL